MKLIKTSLLLFTLLSNINYFSQNLNLDTSSIETEYFNTSASFTVSNTITGFSLNLEYQKMTDLKYSYSFSYNHTLGVENLFNYGIGSATIVHADFFTINGYYRVNLWKKNIFWDLGIGAGAVNISSDSYKNNEIKFLAKLNFMLNIKLSNNIHLYTDAIPILLPTNKIYFFQNNPLNKKVFNYFGFDLYQIGLKFKL